MGHELMSELRYSANGAPDAASAAQVRDPGGWAGMSQRQGNAGNSAPELARGTTTPAGHDLFSALDADRTSPAPAWIHAGAHHAEAGYLDPALGWVGVRAEVAGSGVHATVLPGSAEAAQMLGSHIAGLNAYLAEHQGHSAAAVTLGAPQDGSAGLGMDQGSSASDGNQGHAGAEGGRKTRQAASASGPATLPAVAAAQRRISTGTSAPGNAGSYISVMA